MGGEGSGRPRTSDEDKRRAGTFRADRSEETYAARDAAKVLQGPWLSAIPEPRLPLNEVGREEYDRLTRMLFDQNKLTDVAWIMANNAAALWQKIHSRMAEGRSPATLDIREHSRIVAQLGIARDAPVKASPTKNRFADAGFSNRRASPFRLRPSRVSGS